MKFATIKDVSEPQPYFKDKKNIISQLARSYDLEVLNIIFIIKVTSYINNDIIYIYNDLCHMNNDVHILLLYQSF